MKQRNRALRAAEILLITGFIMVFFLAEQKVVTVWFSTSMRNSLLKIISTMEENSRSGLHDREQQTWAEGQVAKLAAYYLKNDAVQTDTEDTLREFCDVFDVDEAYLIDRNGHVTAGSGALTEEDCFTEPYFADLLNVTEESPVSEEVNVLSLPEEFLKKWGEEFPVFISCYLNDNSILVLHRKEMFDTSQADTQKQLDWGGIYSTRVFGSDSSFFVTFGSERELIFLSAEDKEAHPELVDAEVPEKACRSGFQGFIQLAGKNYYCCTRYSTVVEACFYCIVPASAIVFTALFVSLGVLFVVLFFIFLMRMYMRLILPDAIRSTRKKESGKGFRKNLSILMLTAVIVTLIINIFSTTLFLYAERIQTDSERSQQLAEELEDFGEKQKASSLYYNTYISGITKAAAALAAQNPEFMETAKLQELADLVAAERILIYDNNCSVIASNRNYNGLYLSRDPKSMSYEFRWVIRGEPLLIQDKPDEDFLKEPYRYSGAAMIDSDGNYKGMLQIAMDPELFNQMESSLTLTSVLSTFAPEKSSVVLAVETKTGKVFSSDDDLNDETADSLNLTKEILEDDFTGFFYLKKNKVIGACHNCEDYHVIVASPTAKIPASGVKGGFWTALPGIVAEVIFFLILVFYVRSCRKMNEEEIHSLLKHRRIETSEAGQHLHRFFVRVLVIFAGAVSAVYFFRNSLFAKGSVEYYIFINNWAKGFHVFSIARCLIYIAIAVFVLAASSILLNAIASLVMARQETFIRMALSFFKYGVGIATIYICASMLGAPTASLLASAGILSVMLSFGAQSIVADIISGLFIVFEGTFKVGDMITVDGWHGQVVEIGIRNTKMRDLISEDVKIMNNSTIRTIINFSERPSYSSIMVGVDYDTDIPALEAAFEREKAAMKKNIPYGIGEILYMGIDQLSDSQMTLKFQILCRNQDDLKVKRALNREVRLMFARNGITIPFPQVTLSSREDADEEKDVRGQKPADEEIPVNQTEIGKDGLK